MKSEHEIMLERLQKWRGENSGKGKSSVTVKPVAGAVGGERKRLPVGMKKPLCSANAKNVTVKSAQKKQSISLKKRMPVQPRRIQASQRQPESPDMPMSKKLELWKAQKEKAATSLGKSATKRPWRGGGTPLVNPTKQVARQTPAGNEHSVSVQREINSCTKKRKSGRCSATRSAKEQQIKNDTFQLDSKQDVCDLPPVMMSLSPSSETSHDVSNTQLEQSMEQVQHGSDDHDHPINSSLKSNLNSSSAAETVDGMQSIMPEEQVVGEDEEDECDFILHSSLETLPSVDETQNTLKLSTPHQKSPFPLSRQTPKSAGKGSICKSAMKKVVHQIDKRGEQRNVKFTTPLRCSPRLAKVGVGSTATQGATPKSKGDMRDRLQQWLLEKGKTPSRYSNLLNFQRNTPADRLRKERRRSHQSTPARSHLQSTNDEADARVECSAAAKEKLNAMLEECLTLLHEGCPADHVNNWLDNICRRLPLVEQCAKYWLCRATATELDGADYHDVVGVFEEAAEAGAQPVDEIKDALKEFVMRMGQDANKEEEEEEEKDTSPSVTPVSTPQAVMTNTSFEETPKAESHISSVVKPTSLAQHLGMKYCLTDTTPLFKRVNTTPYYTPGLMITPVRRSVRLESRRSFLPANLKDHDVCVSSLADLPADAPTEFILRYNRALEGEFDDGVNG